MKNELKIIVRSNGWVNKNTLKRFVSQIQGLDIYKLNSCFEVHNYKCCIKADIALAASFGFLYSIFCNSFNSNDDSDPEKIRGTQPFDAFNAVIDRRIG